MSDSKELAQRIARILRKLAGWIEENPDLLKGIGLDVKDVSVAARKKKEEQSIDFDIFKVYSEGGEDALRLKLNQLDIKTLVSVVRQHGLDPSKLAEKWKDKDRLIALILERVSARSGRGKVFKEYL